MSDIGTKRLVRYFIGHLKEDYVGWVADKNDLDHILHWVDHRHSCKHVLLIHQKNIEYIHEKDVRDYHKKCDECRHHHDAVHHTLDDSRHQRK